MNRSYSTNGDSGICLQRMDRERNEANLHFQSGSLDGDSDEYESGIKELSKLADQGIISKEERVRRSQLITKFVQLEIGEDDEYREDTSKSDKFSRLVNNIDYFSSALTSCLRDCFLGRYEVD